jgi:hypothetical protein
MENIRNSWGDPDAMVKAFEEAMVAVRVAAERRIRQGEVNDPWSVLTNIERIAVEVAQGLHGVEEVIAALRAAANEQFEVAFDITLGERRWAVEQNRRKVFRAIRESYSRYTDECSDDESSEVARPIGWTSWVGEAWGGDRRRGDKDVELASEEPVDQRQHGPRRSGRPVSASHLADQYRQLAIGSPRDFPPPPARGPQNVTGGWWPRGMFVSVRSWSCDSDDRHACRTPWTSDELDEWLRTTFGEGSARYDRAIASITDQVLKQLGIGTELMSLRRSKKTNGPEWTDAVIEVVDHLQKQFDFLPTPHRAPSTWGWACPGWRHCGGMLRPQLDSA